MNTASLIFMPVIRGIRLPSLLKTAAYLPAACLLDN